MNPAASVRFDWSGRPEKLCIPYVLAHLSFIIHFLSAEPSWCHVLSEPGQEVCPQFVCVCSTLGNFTVPVNALVRSGPRSDFRPAGATGRPVVNSLRFFYFIFAATAGAALHPVKSLRRATLAPTQVLSATRLIRLRSLDCVGSLHILLDGRRPVSFPSFTSLRFFLANPLSWTSWLCRDALLSSGTMLVVSCLVKV